MRAKVDASRIERFMAALGRAARSEGCVFLTGGTSAVLIGWRESTIDVDLSFDPEPAGVFEALARLKDELDLNVELASPAHFIPPLPGWRERCRHIVTHGRLQFFHYDFVAQALSKIERGHAQDISDVREMVSRGLVAPAALRECFDQIEPELIRYPAIDADLFRQKVQEALADV